ncbi:triosephosphate isomerase [Aurantiacibacter atlanticus]|uniref:Triosephosphate isomerase n=2 Tax=Aurantiacibacter atlanticus TaxID=1648404 RepID=A0A0H4VG32_9SPHN|nr:triosephosphate isomerase [Aurantiacibacter atlanticus]
MEITGNLMNNRPFIVGNWKMHGTRAMLAEARAIDRAAERLIKVEVAIAPPFTLIHATRKEASLIGIGAQDCHPADGGAHTGDISAAMAKDAGAGFTIVGHSERRTNHAETNELVKEKANAVIEAGMNVIVCVGETESQRDSGDAESVITDMLTGSLPEGDIVPERLTVAYEPVWAIGTGRTPSPDDIGKMHRHIRGVLNQTYGEAGASIRILYGGSVKPENAGELLSADDVGGALVGGASLTAESFLGIIMAAVEIGGD